MVRRIFIFLMLFFFSVGLSAQISMQNLHTVKVDYLSDAQISDFVKKYTDAGYTLSDVEQMAKAKNMPSSEFEKLKQRINRLESQVNQVTISEVSEGVSDMKEVEKINNAVSHNKVDSRIFGASLFSNSKLSFEPGQNIATPKNYKIGPSDVLHVDVYGMSEATYDLTVSKDGAVRIPGVGLIQVNGLTIERAENLLKKKLTSVYSTIASGRTSVSVSVNKIRSIKVYILGEVVNPGSYTLTSVSSVFNALNACGGPSNNGSMRCIRLVRDGKQIAEVDLYEFLMKGVMPSDVTLQDQDVIQVPPYQSRITINGAVKRDGIYELKQGETLQDLLNYSGGFIDAAYTERISVSRNMGGEKSVADVPSEMFGMFTPASGDVYQVGEILEKYTNRVQIVGSVFRPGVYALEKGMSLRDLITKANGLTEDAFMEQASLVRLQEDLTPEIISFSVKDLMDGNFNIELQKEDIVTIGGKDEFNSEKRISIYGQVFEPGSFPYYENMTLKDVVFMAKGFKDEADPTKIEVVRQIWDDEKLAYDDVKTEVFVMSMEKDLSGPGGDFKIEPRDQITIRSKVGLERLGTIQIIGEVRMPGHYAITRKTEKISDAMARCGGVTEYAYPKGAFLIRTSNRTEAEKQRDKKILEMLLNQTDAVNDSELKEELSSRRDLVGIKLERIIDRPGCDVDLNIEDGDIIFVPKEMQTVTIGGEVQVPGKEVYSGSSLRKYIRGAGGFGDRASKRKVYVAYSNGAVKSTRHFLWFKNYPDVEPGAHIFVPEKPAKSDNAKENASFFVSLFGSIVSMASVIVTAISVVNK